MVKLFGAQGESTLKYLRRFGAGAVAIFAIFEISNGIARASEIRNHTGDQAAKFDAFYFDYRKAMDEALGAKHNISGATALVMRDSFRDYLSALGGDERIKLLYWLEFNKVLNKHYGMNEPVAR